MAVYSFEGRKPVIGRGTYVHPSADIIGNVVVGGRCFIGPGARIRGDYGRIEIGSNTAVEDNCVIHARPGEQTRIGDWVTLGHGAIIHNCSIADWVVVGMGAVVSDYAELGEWCVIGEGGVVRNNQKVAPGAIAVGVPVKVVGEVSQEYKDQWRRFKEIYSELAEKRYLEGLKPL
ncbi:MAG: gamma carbonic anhydrase family protein [Methanobacteriota archaeon]|nr:MAG: gamma carbonic anhydrase family protein [Euryarchaeota archaeon]